MKTCDVDKKIVAIVTFGSLVRNEDGTWPFGFGFTQGQFFQVTIDPARFSEDGQFIRFGTYPGDEINGWQLASAIGVVSILGKWEGEGGETPPTMVWGASPALKE